MLTAFEQRLVSLIGDINRRTGAPAATRTIVVHLGSVPQRTVQRWLRCAELNQAITRLTPKTGWLLPDLAPRVAHLRKNLG